MNSKANLLILAGGLGSRYKGSKQIDCLGFQAAFLLEFAIYDAVQAGFSKVILLVNKRILPEMESQLSHWKKHVQLSFVLQELSADELMKSPVDRQKPWGTAHAVCCAKNELTGPFVVMNADDYYGKTVFRQAIDFFQLEEINHGLIAFPLLETLSRNGGVSRGICSIESGQLNIIDEQHGLQVLDSHVLNSSDEVIPKDALVSMNFWLFQLSILDHLSAYFQQFFTLNHGDMKKECYLPLAIHEGIEVHKFQVSVLTSMDCWVGLTFPEDRTFVEDYMNELTNLQFYPKSFVNE